MRLVDADEVENKLAELWEKSDDVNAIGYDELMDIIYEAPTVDAEPIRYGKWVWDDKFGEWYCSECQHHKDTEHPMYKPPYCNCCGAKMEGE